MDRQAPTTRERSLSIAMIRERGRLGMLKEASMWVEAVLQESLGQWKKKRSSSQHTCS